MIVNCAQIIPYLGKGYISTCCLFALCSMAVAGVTGSDKASVRTAFFKAITASECAPLALEANTMPGLSSNLILESNCTTCIFLQNKQI
jgi:hypothetical protein